MHVYTNLSLLQVSAYPPDPTEELEQLELREEDVDRTGVSDEEQLVPPEEAGLGRVKKLFHAMIEQRKVRVFFRVCATVNVLSLIFSAPLLNCEEERDSCRITFVVIATVDLVLSILYSIHAIARMEYASYLYKKRKVSW